MGQKEEIERLIGEAYADLRTRSWGEFDRTISELSLYDWKMIEDIIREKMGKVDTLRAMELAYIYDVVTAFPFGEHGHSPQRRMKTIPEVEYPIPILPELEDHPDQRAWLAAMYDAEGFPREQIVHADRVNAKYRYTYKEPRLVISSVTEALAEKVGKLTLTTPVLERRPKPLEDIYRVFIRGSKAISTIHYTLPYIIRNKELSLAILKRHRKRIYVPLPL